MFKVNITMTKDELLFYAFCKKWDILVKLIQNYDITIQQSKSESPYLFFSIHKDTYQKLGENNFLQQLDNCAGLIYVRKDWHYDRIGFVLTLPKIYSNITT
jgi:hypothetical protein